MNDLFGFRAVQQTTMPTWNKTHANVGKIAVLVREWETLPMLVVGAFEGLTAYPLRKHDPASFEWSATISRYSYVLARGDTLRIFQGDEPLVGTYHHSGRTLSLQDSRDREMQEVNAAIQSIAEAY